MRAYRVSVTKDCQYTFRGPMTNEQEVPLRDINSLFEQMAIIMARQDNVGYKASDDDIVFSGYTIPDYEDDLISEFYEKAAAAEGWINGGYFVLNAGVLDYIEGDESIWERAPVERLVRDGQLMGYRHYGFWSCMDTLKEKNMLEALWQTGEPPWRIWDRPLARAADAAPAPAAAAAR